MSTLSSVVNIRTSSNSILSKVAKKASSRKNVVSRSSTVTNLHQKTEKEKETCSAPNSTTSPPDPDILPKVHNTMNHEPWLWPWRWAGAGFAKGQVLFSSFELHSTSSTQLQGVEGQVRSFLVVMVVGGVPIGGTSSCCVFGNGIGGNGPGWPRNYKIRLVQIVIVPVWCFFMAMVIIMVMIFGCSSD